MPSNRTHTEPLRFGREVDPDCAGMSAAGVRRLTECFDEQLARGLHPGAQLVVLRHGQVVVDRARGLADTGRSLAVTPRTPFLTFSVTKPFVALCIHHLLERGRLALDAPIARYWPEFGCAGKETATVRHALLHQTGIPVRGLEKQVPLWPSWRRVIRSVAALEAEHPPGEQSAYHIVNYGFILGELVRRVSGMPVSLYLRHHFLNPLGLRETWLGLPRRERGRVAHLYCGHPEQRNTVILFNFNLIRSAVIPAATLYSTARELAIAYQMLLNGGCYGGRRLLKRESVAFATGLGYAGYDGTFQAGMRWGYGFQLGGTSPEIAIGYDGQGMGHGSSQRTFGHFGKASSMTWADPDAELVVTFTCNRLLSSEESIARWQALSDRVWEALL